VDQIRVSQDMAKWVVLVARGNMNQRAK